MLAFKEDWTAQQQLLGILSDQSYFCKILVSESLGDANEFHSLARGVAKSDEFGKQEARVIFGKN